MVDAQKEGVRLHRYIAQCGVCSRRRAEEFIEEGRVTLNGEVVTKLGTKTFPGDDVKVDGAAVRPQKLVYLVMYKPKGVVTTMSDDRGRRTVADLLPRLESTVKPVGRLDMDTDGLLLFTNDGDLATSLSHPSRSVEKEYEATVEGEVSDSAIARIRKGVVIEGRKTKTAECEVLGTTPSSSKLRITITEGWKRQVRLMCEAVGHPVIELRRTRYGPLRLKGMAPGECRLLGQQMVESLRKAAEKK